MIDKNILQQHIKKLEKIAWCMRRDILTMIYHAQSGHVGGSLSCVEIIATLYFYAMNYSCEKSNSTDEIYKYFCLTPSHIVEKSIELINKKNRGGF